MLKHTALHDLFREFLNIADTAKFVPTWWKTKMDGNRNLLFKSMGFISLIIQMPHTCAPDPVTDSVSCNYLFSQVLSFYTYQFLSDQLNVQKSKYQMRNDFLGTGNY